MTVDLELARQVGTIARAAGDAIVSIYHSDFTVQTKADASPVTAADLAAQRVIVAALTTLQPALPVLSEESDAVPWDVRRHWSRYWLVDPLDGTREFVKRNGEFTVNIALIEDHRSVLGAVLAPVTGALYVAARDAGAWLQATAGGQWQRVRTRALAEPAVLAGSRSHGKMTEATLHALLGPAARRVALGSSLKFCLIAQGAADVYLRLGATSEWDTAAAQCVLHEAGGALIDLAGRPLAYNHKPSLINPEFVAVGDPRVDWIARLRGAGL
ncbi:MAG: 3'(2'),5'-bisphosphate nucleotidase CysQ [Rhodanobacter sp.]